VSIALISWLFSSEGIENTERTLYSRMSRTHK